MNQKEKSKEICAESLKAEIFKDRLSYSEQKKFHFLEK